MTENSETSDMTRNPIYLMAIAMTLLLCGCKSADVLCEPEEFDFVHEVNEIIVDPDTDLEVLRKVMNDWDGIGRSIYDYHQEACTQEDFSIDSISWLETIVGPQRNMYLERAGISEPDDETIVLSIGTKLPCLSGTEKHEPDWVILYADDSYTVVDVLIQR